MKALWVLCVVLWLCVVAATVDLLVFGNPSAVNGVIGAGLGAVMTTTLVAMWRKDEQ